MLDYFRALGFKDISKNILTTTFDTRGVRFEVQKVGPRICIYRMVADSSKHGKCVYDGFVDSQRFVNSLVLNLGITEI